MIDKVVDTWEIWRVGLHCRKTAPLLAVDDLVLTSRAISSGIDKSHLEGRLPVAG
jgi:hypothetical protein